MQNSPVYDTPNREKLKQIYEPPNFLNSFKQVPSLEPISIIFDFSTLKNCCQRKGFCLNEVLPLEISTVEISGKARSLKKLDFPWKPCDFGVLLVEISEVLPAEISTTFFYSISAFTGKNHVIWTKRKKCLR